MTCPICKYGKTKQDHVTVTLERGKTAIIFRDVPADVCENCGEAFHSSEITSELLRQAEAAIVHGVEVDIRRFELAA